MSLLGDNMIWGLPIRACLTLTAVFVTLLGHPVTGFTPCSHRGGVYMSSPPTRNHSPQHRRPESRHDFLVGFTGCALTLALPLAVRADPLSEKFVEDEICIERNLNGSCKKSGIGDRKALEEVVDASKKASGQDDPDNELIAKLKKRTIENKARNDEEIATKTFVNGQSGEFGPFSRYVPVKHKDTGRYELILVGELDEMRRKGVIVKERGQEVFTDAQETK